MYSDMPLVVTSISLKGLTTAVLEPRLLYELERYFIIFLDFLLSIELHVCSLKKRPMKGYSSLFGCKMSLAAIDNAFVNCYFPETSSSPPSPPHAMV